jgi:hypothetical protein
MLVLAETASAKRAGKITMATGTRVRSSWAVRNRAGQVVVIFEGTNARTAATEWADARGYHVESVVLN